MKKKKKKRNAIYLLKFIDVSNERISSIKLEVSRVSNQQPEEVERGTIWYNTGRAHMLAACLLGLHFDPEDGGNVSPNFYQTTQSHVPEGSLHHSHCHKNLKHHKKKQEVLGRTNRLLSFDTRST
jgi:hypothetical protein